MFTALCTIPVWAPPLTSLTDQLTVSDLDPSSSVAAPDPVGNMAVASTSVDQLTVTWTPPTTGGIQTGYNVTINDSSSLVVMADNGSPVYTHTFTGLVSDALYTVSVVAINCAGASNAVPHHTSVPTSYNVTINDSSSPVVIADNGSPVHVHPHLHWTGQ
eukprot:Em0006g363a